jgi:hypothetical protein
MSTESLKCMLNDRLSSNWGKKPSQSDGLELHRRVAKVRDDDYPPMSGWRRVLERLGTHPHESNVRDCRGRTLLMRVFEKAGYAPKNVLQKVLETTAFQMELARDKTGLTALMIALQVYAPIESIRLLLSKNVTQASISDHDGNLPLHTVVRRITTTTAFSDDLQRKKQLVDLLLEQGLVEEQCLYQNHKGQTPLHVATENRLARSILEKLIQACPEAVARNDCGYTPLVLAIREELPLAVLELFVQTNPSITKILDQDGKYPLRRAIEKNLATAQIVRLLCTSSETVVVESKGKNSLLVYLEHSNDPSVVQILLQAAPLAACSVHLQLVYAQYHESRHHHWWLVLLRILQAANAPDFPLRAAIATHAPVPVVERILKDFPETPLEPNEQGMYPLHLACRMQQCNVKGQVVSMILQAYPRVATIPSPRYPLAMVAEYGGIDSDVVKQLIQACPKAVSTRDPTFQLFPFVVAAIMSADVQVIYEMLLSAPELVR